MQWNLALDIGGSGVRMAARGRGVIFRQSAACCVRKKGGELVCLGDEALSFLGRVGSHLEVGFPMRSGVVAREDLLRIWLKHLLSQALGGGLAHRARVLVAVAGDLPPAQERRLNALLMEAGAAACACVRADLAAALGAGLKADEPPASLVLDVGATQMYASLLSLGRVVRRESLPYGLDRADEAIARALRAQEALAVGPRTAQELKHTLATALGAAHISQDARGLDLATGFAGARQVPAELVAQAVKPIAQAAVELAQRVVESAPVELAADLNDSGICLTGGGARLFGLDKQVAEATGLTCILPEDPAACTILGLAKMIEDGARFASLP